MPRIAIAQLRDGDTLDQPFILADKQIATTASNKLYIKANCTDATGQIHCRMWNATRDHYSLLPASGYVQVRGRIETYQGHLQMIADGIHPIEDFSKIDLRELLPHTKKNVAEMAARVREIMGTVKDPDVAGLLQSFLHDAEFMKRFSLAPAAQGLHHAWIGGLMEHTLSLLELAMVICPRYPDVERDLVLAGLFLHDVAKTAELSYTCGFSYTDEGKLLGHVVMGAMWVGQRAQEVSARSGKAFPKDLLLVLQHIILSHHGVPEFGAAVLPKTPEAVLVNLIDNLDAKTQMALDAVASPTETGSWTEYHRAFNTSLYRPSVTSSH